MGTAKISGFIIGLIIVSFIVAVISLNITTLSANYGVGWNNTSLDSYNKMNELSVKVENISTSVENFEEKPGLLDIVGGFFSNAYKVLLVSKDSINLFDDMSNNAIDQANLGSIGTYLKIIIPLIVIVLIFLGVIVRAIVKEDI